MYLLAAALAVAIVVSGPISSASAHHVKGCHSRRCDRTARRACAHDPKCAHRVAARSRYCGSATCNRRLGRYLAIRRYGIGGWNCTYPIIDQESGWNVRATNPYSGAYGIPQALPGGKMAAAGADWATNPRTQIRWLLTYLHDRYGGPCQALAHKRATGWY